LLLDPLANGTLAERGDKPPPQTQDTGNPHTGIDTKQPSKGASLHRNSMLPSVFRRHTIL
jgi:hypothetical protein